MRTPAGRETDAAPLLACAKPGRAKCSLSLLRGLIRCVAPARCISSNQPFTQCFPLREDEHDKLEILMENLPNCPKCNSEYVYSDGSILICPECAHEFQAEDAAEKVYKDVNGTVLSDGDTVIVTQDLKVKGASSPIKKGTKVKNIKLVEPEDGVHDISCKIAGFGSMMLKTSVVKKG